MQRGLGCNGGDEISVASDSTKVESMLIEVSAVRLDKWLWSVRLFKTRSIASEACKKGNIKLNGRTLKPSYKVSLGDLFVVHKDGFNLSILVTKLIGRRVSASLAVECYENQTSEEEMNKYAEWFIGKAAAEKRLPGAGRPTKKERRVLDGFKEDFYLETDD